MIKTANLIFTLPDTVVTVTITLITMQHLGEHVVNNYRWACNLQDAFTG